jgi:hypothetical protein
VEEGAALPEVELASRLRGGNTRRSVRGGQPEREAVVRHVVEGLRGELVGQLMEVLW